MTIRSLQLKKPHYNFSKNKNHIFLHNFLLQKSLILKCIEAGPQRGGRAGYFCRGPRLKGGPKQRDLPHFGSYFVIFGT
jgi:hypothetical protein